MVAILTGLSILIMIGKALYTITKTKNKSQNVRPVQSWRAYSPNTKTKTLDLMASIAKP